MSAPTRVIVIGAGIAGLVAAKTYLQVCKHLGRPLELIVLDEARDSGGVWTTERHYPGLMVQAPNGYYELSDFSMVDEEHPWDSLIPAAREQAYLESYARRFDVYDKIRFSTVVVKVSKREAPSPPGWFVETASGEVLECDKLIVASGLYSKPRPIPISVSAYAGTAVHSRDLGRVHERICNDPTVKDVVVVGACKSAVEACSVFLASHKRVHWLVRPSDQGAPLIISHPEAKPNPLAIAGTRLFPAFSPSMWSTSGFWYSFLHSGRWILGTWLVQGFFNLMSWMITREIHYGKSQNSAKIQPKRKSMFFYTTYLSLVVEGHPFFDALHEDNPEKLTVYRATPVKCEGRELVVNEEDSGPRTLPADAIIWSIGWEPGLDFFEPAEAAEIGLPVRLSSIGNKNETSSAPAKGAAPIQSPVTPTDLDLPALEFYDGKICHPAAGFSIRGETQGGNNGWSGPEELKLLADAEIRFNQAFQERRYGLRGARSPEMILEARSYIDMLCRDLGIEPQRKRYRMRERNGGALPMEQTGWWDGVKNWFREYFEPYIAPDFKGAVEEFLRNRETALREKEN
ncbi:hypothetical protein CLAIMM_12134 [Cladophialophora immunda]|nr:hypothetical protein CLAIMM_12134 [Cladophialophora immunda]